jgi:hypothetical protein
MAKVGVFISFDYDHDNDLKIMLVGQSKNPDSPFEIIDQSVKVASPDWEADARRRIRRADVVAVICGHHTDTATGVNKEIRIARDEKRSYFLLAGRAAGNNKKPTAALSGDKIYNWTWPNLKTLIGAAGRWMRTPSGSTSTSSRWRWPTACRRAALRRTPSS